MVDNCKTLSISHTNSNKFSSILVPSHPLILNNILYVPLIAKKLLCVSQFAKDDNVFSEFYSTHCYVKD